MVKVNIQLYPVVYARDWEERQALRPLGRNVERYQDCIAQMPDLIRAIDALGCWGVSTIEHHFHSEGYEVGPMPGILTGYWAAITENVRIGSLGYSLTAQDPIRVAEETAILDHMTKGRCFVGFSRGYQHRWTNVLGQHLGAVATLSDTGTAQRRDEDERNRRIFEEQVEIVLKAWTEDSFSYKGEGWEYPYPYADGIRDWWMGNTTRDAGAPREMDAAGVLREVSVVPAPYTKPHPPIFIASRASIETVEYAAAKNFIPTYFSGTDQAAKFGPRYTELARAAGRNIEYGESQAIVRWTHLAETDAEAEDQMIEYSGEIFQRFYATSRLNYAEQAQTATRADLVRMMSQDTGLFFAGSPATVRDKFIEQWKKLPAEYVTLIFHYAQQPLTSVIENIRLFMEEVKPALDEIVDYPDDRSAAAE